MCCTDKGENWGKACAYDVYAVGERMACVYNLYIWKEWKVKKILRIILHYFILLELLKEPCTNESLVYGSFLCP